MSEYPNRNNDDVLRDPFDAWLQSCPPVKPLAGLRDRCRATISDAIQSRPGRLQSRFQEILQMRITKTAIGMSALAATLAAVWLFGFSQESQSVFAQALEKTRLASTAHIVVTFSDPARDPNEVREREYWWVRGVVLAQVMKTNGKVTRRILWRDGMKRVWDARTNTVRHEADMWDLNTFFPEFINPEKEESDIVNHEKWAKEQDVPIQVEMIRMGKKKIRRVRIEGLRVDKLETEPEEAAMIATMAADIDVSTNRIVAIEYHYKAVGSDGRNRFAPWDSSTYYVIDYPDPAEIDHSVFE